MYVLPSWKIGRTFFKTHQHGGDHTVPSDTLPDSLYTMKLAGCQVSIKCNRRILREVGTVVAEDGKMAECYIPTHPGEVSVEMWLTDHPTVD